MARKKRNLTRILKSRYISNDLLQEDSLINHAIVQTEREKELAIDIFNRVLIRRHDVSIITVRTFDRSLEAVILVRTDEFDEEKYFQREIQEVILKENVTPQQVFEHHDTINYGYTQQPECFSEMIDMLSRQDPAELGILAITKVDLTWIALLLYRIDEEIFTR